MEKIEKKFSDLNVTFNNVSQAQAMALIKMFKYMEYCGDIGHSAMCGFYSDGDGDFRPKIIYNYSELLPNIDNNIGIMTNEKIEEAIKNNRRIAKINQGDFFIDFDTIAHIIEK
jgi:hypothetical protein